MWYLVHVVKGSKYFEAESLIGNRVLISDCTDMVVAGRSMGTDGYRFEARKGNESFVFRDFDAAQAAAAQTTGSLSKHFDALARTMGAVEIATAA
jgi:hypothetical protein